MITVVKDLALLMLRIRTDLTAPGVLHATDLEGLQVSHGSISPPRNRAPPAEVPDIK